MSQEQGPEKLDASIDPKLLVEQQGEDMGRVAAVERIEGEPDKQSELGRIYSTTTSEISGLPVIGAEGEQTARKQIENWAVIDSKITNSIGDKLQDISKNNPDATPKQREEIFYDQAGEDAMAAEVSRRAIELVSGASQELLDAVGKQAADNFRAELEAKKAEKQAAADAKAQTLLDKLRSGAPLSSVLPTEDSTKFEIEDDPSTKVDRAFNTLNSVLANEPEDYQNAGIATETLLHTGQTGRQRLAEAVRAINSGDHSPATEAIKSNALKLFIKKYDAVLDRFAIDPEHRDYASIESDPETYLGLSLDLLANQDVRVLEAAEACGAINQDIARDILGSGNPALTTEAIAIFTRIANGEPAEKP